MDFFAIENGMSVYGLPVTMDSRSERFAIARSARALSAKIGKARTALIRLKRVGSRLARDPRSSHRGESGISVLDVFQSASVLLNKHYDFCCSNPEQLPLFNEMYNEAIRRLLPASQQAEFVL